jgi:hypothetical protein
MNSWNRVTEPSAHSKTTMRRLMEEEKMPRKIIRRFAAAMFALVIIGVTTLAQPAKAVFVNYDFPQYSIRDSNGTLYFLVITATCYYYVDGANDTWALFTPMHYFTTDVSFTAPPIVFGTLRNTRTSVVWDGGFAAFSFFPSTLYRGTASPSCF